jgi:hypothetical protein
MKKLEMTVRYLDGTSADVRVLPVTEVAFEREFKKGIASFAEDPHNEHLYWLAWHSCRNGAGFDAWLETIETVELEVEEATPTGPAQPAT